ncbi:BspA family leucine-rich repeat surface protein [Winogradskyella sp.]|uniref:BspA family leucine-rich repeat surface protein n=1 Tax=Winogradskyella sp. TaxID=1883156 RepID=UPI003BACC875
MKKNIMFFKGAFIAPFFAKYFFYSLILVLPLLWSGNINAQCTVSDNINIQPPFSDGYGLTSAFGQTFTPSCSGPLTKLSLFIDANDANRNDVGVVILRGTPTNHTVLQTLYNLNLPAVDDDTGVYEMNINTNVSLTANETYTVYLAVGAGTARVKPFVRTGNPYSGGNFWYIEDLASPDPDTSSWTSESSRDLAMRVHMGPDNPPQLTCNNITVDLGADNAEFLNPDLIYSATDDDGIYVVNIDGTTAYDCTHIGDHILTVTVEDTGGNTASCTATVTVIEEGQPNLSCQSTPVDAVLGENNQANVSLSSLISSASDNCPSLNRYLGVKDFSGTITTGSQTDQLIPGLTFYVDEYEFEAPADGEYKFVFTGTSYVSSTAIDAIMVILWDGDPQANTGHYQQRTNYMGYTFRRDNGTYFDTYNDATRYYTLSEGQTYKFYVLGANEDATATYSGKVLMRAPGGSELTLDYTCSDIGTHTIDVVVDDASENYTSCTATVNVVDNTPPGITCPSNPTVGTDPAQCFATGVFASLPTVSDNCTATASIQLVLKLESGDTVINPDTYQFPTGQTSVRWEATDASGNMTSCTSTVTVTESTPEPPTFVSGCQNINTAGSDPGQCYATNVFPALPTVTDNCTPAESIQLVLKLASNDQVIDPFTYQFPVDTVTNIKWEATDASGNVAYCANRYVYVYDHGAPTMSCTNSVDAVLDGSGNATVSLSDITNGSTDNCEEASDLDTYVGVYEVSGATTTSSNTDAILNSANTWYYAEHQFVAPVTGQYRVTANGTSSDGDGIRVYAYSVAPTPNTGFFHQRPGFIGEVTFTDDGTINYPDNTRNFNLTGGNTYYFTIKTRDHSETLTYNVNWMRAATDLTYTCNDIGTHDVKVFLGDSNLNYNSCTTTITVKDETEPIISGCADITVGTDSGLCYATNPFGTSITVTDNCTPTESIQLELKLSDDSVIDPTTYQFLVGETAVKWVATDASGNVSTTCNMLVTVNDNTGPVISGCANVTVEPDTDQCYATNVSIAIPTATDNCTPDASIPIELRLAEGPIIDPTSYQFPIGDTTIEWRATDASGNMSSCTATVTVTDIIQPTIVCNPNPVNAVLDGNNEANVSLSSLISSTSDCSATNTYLGVMDFSGATTVNSDVDVLVPGSPFYVDEYQFVAPADGEYKFVFTGTSTRGPFPVNAISVIVWDNNGPQVNGGLYTQRSSFVGFTSRRDNGTRIDGGTLYYNLTGGETYKFYVCGADVTAIATYSGKVLMKAPNGLNFTCSDVGTHTIDVVVDDASENYNSCTATINVGSIPTITCPANVIVNNTDPGQCTATNVSLGTATATDSCGSPVTAVPQIGGVTIDPTTYAFNTGRTTVTWVATDAFGNSNTCQQKVWVYDNEAPSGGSCNNSLDVQLDANGAGSVALSQLHTGFTDNCANTLNTYVRAMDFNGETTTSSSVDDIRGNGSVHYYDLYEFTPSVSGQYKFAFNGTTTSPPGETPVNELYMILWDAVPQSTGAYSTRPEYYGYQPRFEDGTPNSEGDEEVFALQAGTTYYFYILGLNPESTITYSGHVLLTSVNSLDYNCNDIGSSYQVDIAIEDDRFNYATCSATVNVTSPVLTASCQDITVQLDASGTATVTAADINASTIACNANSVTAELKAVVSQPVSGTLNLNESEPGQSFTATTTGWLTKIRIKVWQDYNNKTVYFYNSNNGSGTTSSIGTPVYTESGVSLAVNNGGWTEITLSTPLPVVEGNAYSFIIGGLTRVYLDFSDAYDGGDHLDNYGRVISNVDMAFEAEIDYDATFDTNDIGVNTVPLLLTNANGDTAACTANVTVEDTRFVTKWVTTQNGESITIPTTGGGYNYTVHWGDSQNTVTTGITGDATFTYDQPGTYTVSISGTFPRIYFNYGNGNEKIHTIEQWGANPWTSMENAFAGCTNLQVMATDAPDLSNASSLSQMFAGATKLNSDLSHWDVSTITTMYAMFYNAEIFNQPLNNWNVSNVTNMAAMFQDAKAFNQPLDSWNVGSVLRMDSMFQSAEAFNQPLNSWNVSSVNDMVSMFEGAKAFNQPIDSWNVSLVTDMDYMFREAEVFNQSIDSWNVSAVVDMIQMFKDAKNFNQPLNSWNVSSVIYMDAMFEGAIAFDQPLNSWNVGSVVNMREMFNGATSFNQPLNSWDVSSVTNMAYMFKNAGLFNQPMGSWNVGSVGDMRSMFEGATAFDQSLNTWSVGSVTNMSSMFNSAISFDQSLNSWDVSSVTNMASMFKNASLFNQQIGGWSVGAVTDMTSMFDGALSFNQPLNNWDVSSVSGMSYMFNSATTFNQKLDNWNVSLITDMTQMFQLATSFNQDISNWNVSAVTNMDSMFENALAFNQPLNTWNVSSVTNMNEMFSGATAFDQELGNWDLTSVTTMTFMFSGVTLSLSNYDATLIGWQTDSSGTPGDATDDVPSGITFDGGSSTYCHSLGHRQDLIDNKGWMISDGGLECTSLAFVTKWVTTENAESITIPTTGNGYNYTVFWGDSQNTVTTGITGDATFTYEQPGTYTVSIVGEFPRIYFNDEIGAEKLHTIEQWGSNSWTSMEGAFYGCSNLQITATDAPDLSNVSGARRMFRGATNFNSDISHWDVSSITDMSSMFAYASTFNQPLNSWNVSNVRDMGFMFQNAIAFNQPLNSWNVGSVTNMRSMFDNASVFNQPIGNWNVGSVNRMDSMFADAEAFNQPLNSWNVGSVTNMSSMFSGADVFDQPIDSWNVSSVTYMPYMFFSAAEFDQPLNSWNVSSAVDMFGMFFYASKFNQPLNNWNVGSVTIMSSMFYGATSFNQPLNSWDVSSVGAMTFMFQDATAFNQPLDSWNVSSVTNMNSMFENATAFNQPLNGWNMSSVSNMNEMFKGATAFDQELSNWDLTSVTTMTLMFDGAGLSRSNYDTTLIGWQTDDSGAPGDAMDDIPNGITFDGGNSTYCLSAVQRQKLIDDEGWIITDGGPECTSLAFITTWYIENANESITIPTTEGGYNYTVIWGDNQNSVSTGHTGNATFTYDQPGTYTVTIIGAFPRIFFNNGGDKDKIRTIEKWGPNSWTSMENAFYGCSNLQINDTSAPDLSNVMSMSGMFRGATNFNSDISQWDVSNVTIMSLMFKDASLFNQQIGGWSVGAVTNMSSMFENAEAFNQPLNNWDVSSVTTMAWMFRSATAFNQPLNSWNVSSVTTMTQMFQLATNFNQHLSNWDVTAVTSMDTMFESATAFNQPLNSWNVSSVTNMSTMFQSATNFNQDLSNWNVSNVTNMQSMFNSATAFNQPLSNWDVSSVTNMRSVFFNCTAFDQDLSNWDISSVSTMEYMFQGVTLSMVNYDATLIGWHTDSSGIHGDGEDDVPSNIEFHGGFSQYCNSETQRQDLITSNFWNITDGGLNCPTTISLSPKVYLQGASLNPNANEGNLMRDDLRVAGMMPVTSPYSDGLTIDNSVLTTTDSNAIVDWVWVELRNELTNTTIIDSQSALLQRDGDVVDVDGTSPVTFTQSAGNYHVVVKHRNHIGVITATPVALNSTATLIDFTNPIGVEGGTNSVVLLANGLYGMYTGDYDGNAQIQNTDANAVVQLIGSSGYDEADMDINTQVQNTDVNVLINPNIGRGEQFTRSEESPAVLSSDMTIAFANAEITNDGTDDFYEADIMISGTTDFYLGSGQVYIDYNTAAFGENISGNGAIEYSQPDGTILGHTWPGFPFPTPAYKDFVENDNTTSRVSLSFQQNIALVGLETAPELAVTNTPKILFHIKIRYADVNEDANICFYSDGVFQDQFFTACGGTTTADCINAPGAQIINDTYDCSESVPSTLSIVEAEADALLLYPNPVSTSFHIKGLRTTGLVRIHDIKGRLVLQVNGVETDQAIDMSPFEDGTYLVEIRTENTSVIKRLIKKTN